jgi:electron transport complex protein RnfC
MVSATLSSGEFEMPCIRCGDCESACPVQLQPQQLLVDLRGDRLAEAGEHGLFDCTECGRCDSVCPSHIALVRRFSDAKTSIRHAKQQTGLADAARIRFEIRNTRLLREALERSERESALAQQATSTDAVAAAIERAKARRQQPKNPS